MHKERDTETDVPDPLVGARILVVTTADSTIAAFLLPLVDALRRHGAVAKSAAACGRTAELLRDRGYPIHPICFSRRLLSFRHIPAAVQLGRLLRNERYDLVHVHTPVASVIGRVVARLAGVPVVCTAHGFYFHERMHPLPRGALLLLEKMLGRRCTDFLFTVSPEDYRTALDFKLIAPGKLHCLNSVGVDLDEFDRKAAAAISREALQLVPEVPIVGFVGRMVKEKGILDLIRAMRLLKEDGVHAQLLVVGAALPTDRVRGFRRKIRNVIAASALEEDVRFVGFRYDVPAILRLVDLLVLPSHREGMPVTILEAMAASKPVVATDIRGCREEVVNGVTGWLVPPADPVALAGAIRKVLDDPEAAAEMGRAGRERVRAVYSEARVLAEQLAVYRKLLREHPRRSRTQETERRSTAAPDG